MVCRDRLLSTRALRSPAVLVTAGLLAGLAVGMLLEAGVTSESTSAKLVAFIEPIGTLWINAIRTTVIPLVVPLLIVGVAGGDDLRAVGSLGVKSFAVFLAMLVACALATALIAPQLFGQLQLDPASTSGLRATAHIDQPPFESLSVRGWLLSLVPVNVIGAAASGALLPVVLFTLVYSFALSGLPVETRTSHVAFFRAMSDVMLTVVRWVLALAPVGIFAVAVTMGQKLGAAVIGAIGFYMVVVILLHVVAIAALYVAVAISGKAKVGEFAKALLPAQIVGFGTRSSLASLPALVQGASEQLRLPSSVIAFVLPLAVSVFKLTSAIYWIVGALFISKLYGVELSAADIALVGGASVLLNFSTPGIPSGGMLLQLPVYAAIELPVEGIGILIALDTVPDMFKTALNVTADMATAVLVSPKNTANAS